MKNPFRRFFARESRQPLTSHGQMFASRTVSAVPVNSETAQKSSAFYAGVRYLGQTLGQMPACVYYNDETGNKTKATHPRYSGVNNLITTYANERLNLTWQKLCEQVIEHCHLYGNFVAEIEFNQGQRAFSLHPLDPARLTFKVLNGEDLVYEYSDPLRGTLQFAPDEVFHIPNFGTRKDIPSIGVSTIEYAAESIGWHQATELFGAAYFANGIHPSVLVTLKHTLTPEAYKIFQDQLDKKFTGSNGAHQPFLTDGDARVEKLSIQPNEAQFVETMQHQIDEIARWVGVPPSKIGHMIHSGVRANVEHASIEVIRDHIQPWVRRIETEASRKFFPQREPHYVEMDMRSLMRGDMSAMSTYYREMRNVGALNSNEIRGMEGLNSIGPQGDMYVMQDQYMPLEQLGKEPVALPPPFEESENNERQGERVAGGDRTAALLNAPDPSEVSIEDDEAGLRRTLSI